MNSGEKQPAQGGQVFDLVMSGVFAVVAAGFVFRAVELLEEHAPDAGQAAIGLGFAALMLTGVSIACAYRFNGPRDQA